MDMMTLHLLMTQRKMAANKKASKYQPKQQKKKPENDVSSSDSKRRLEHSVSLFSKCTDVPTVTKVGSKSTKAGKASKAPKLRNRM